MPPQSPFSITSAIGDDELRLILAELAKTDLAPDRVFLEKAIAELRQWI
jgi:hypothetical protein